MGYIISFVVAQTHEDADALLETTMIYNPSGFSPINIFGTLAYVKNYPIDEPGALYMVQKNKFIQIGRAQSMKKVESALPEVLLALEKVKYFGEEMEDRAPTKSLVNEPVAEMNAQAQGEESVLIATRSNTRSDRKYEFKIIILSALFLILIIIGYYVKIRNK